MIVHALTLLLSLAGIIVIGLFVVLAILEAIAKARWWIDGVYLSRAVRRVGQDLRNQSYWFSESDEAYLALKTAGEFLLEYGRFDASSVRDKWRKLVDKQEVTS